MTTAVRDTIRFLPDYLSSQNNFEGDNLFILVQKLLIAIFIGALIGLEREHSRPASEKSFAGVRTFPLISIFGFVAALISVKTSSWVYFAVFISYGSLITAAHVFSARDGRPGGTSEVSALLVFILGSLVYWNFIILAAIIAVIVAAFLTLKIQLHRFVGKVSEEDLYAIIKLAIVTVIILPLLPNYTVGPLNVLNPRMIWLMVIFISCISFTGYILIKILGKEKGITITGLLGGLVSSTAVTFSLSKRNKENEILAPEFAVGIILASTIMFPRIFFIVLVLNSSLITDIWLPLSIFTIAGLAVSYYMMKNIKKGKNQDSLELKNPFKLRSALLFGLIFAVIIFISKAAQIYLGNSGIYAASALGGLASVDAIIISLTQLLSRKIDPNIVTIAVIIVIISNNIIKILIPAIWGTKQLTKEVFRGLGIISLTAAVYFLIIIIL
jgi:uncharacterized membrane protein (DUF4010 family)